MRRANQRPMSAQQLAKKWVPTTPDMHELPQMFIESQYTENQKTRGLVDGSEIKASTEHLFKCLTDQHRQAIEELRKTYDQHCKSLADSHKKTVENLLKDLTEFKESKATEIKELKAKHQQELNAKDEYYHTFIQQMTREYEKITEEKLEMARNQASGEVLQQQSKIFQEKELEYKSAVKKMKRTWKGAESEFKTQIKRLNKRLAGVKTDTKELQVAIETESVAVQCEAPVIDFEAVIEQATKVIVQKNRDIAMLQREIATSGQDLKELEALIRGFDVWTYRNQPAEYIFSKNEFE